MRVDDVRCLVVLQPWASLIAIGAKRIETRGWGTHYRGPLLIYAGMRWSRAQCDLMNAPGFRDAFEAAGIATAGAWCGATRTRPLPLGGPIALVKLVGCRKVVGDPPALKTAMSVWSDPVRAEELPLGDFHPGRFGWELSKPIPITGVVAPGSQGLFAPKPWVLDVVACQLGKAS